MGKFALAVLSAGTLASAEAYYGGYGYGGYYGKRSADAEPVTEADAKPEAAPSPYYGLGGYYGGYYGKRSAEAYYGPYGYGGYYGKRSAEAEPYYGGYLGGYYGKRSAEAESYYGGYLGGYYYGKRSADAEAY